jgi:hypothetical protein|uniref:PNPLA domain-containing protein n=1 Tax=viral metagenome TaxID=1070528 RepID=A0A6C0D9D8_9ZZZZ
MISSFLFGFNLFVFCLLISSCSSLNQLSFSGGGSFGAVEIGILKRILDNEQKNTKSKNVYNKLFRRTNNILKYDLYTGISAGALNAALLSYFSDISQGLKIVDYLYKYINNDMIYKFVPLTGLSLLNTEPLRETILFILGKMPNEPIVHTLIGATNLNTGNLDIFSFEENKNLDDKINLLMASSAIPAIFPPIKYNGTLYVDGGTLSNELLQVEHVQQIDKSKDKSKDKDKDKYKYEYLNITFITPYDGFPLNLSPIESLKDVIERTISILFSNFDNPIVTLNQNCENPIGEINKYYLNSSYLNGYNMLHFDKGAELINIGYKYMEHKKYKLC